MREKTRSKSLMTGIQERVETSQKEKEMEIRKQNLETRLQNTLSKYIDFEQSYGPDDYRTVMMKSILETAVMMKDTIKTLEGVKEAFQYMFEAMDIVDLVFNLFQDNLENSLGNNYGFFARLKQKRRLNKAIRNNVSRMRQITTMISGMQTISETTVKALQKSSNKMKKALDKQNKKKAKKGTNTTVDATSVEVNRMIAEHKSKMGIEVKPTEITQPTTGETGPKGGSKGGTTDTGVEGL